MSTLWVPRLTACLKVSWLGKLTYMAVVLGMTSVAVNVLPTFR